MSFIIVLKFWEILREYIFWGSMRAVFNFQGAHHNIFPLYSNMIVLRNLQQRAARF